MAVAADATVLTMVAGAVVTVLKRLSVVGGTAGEEGGERMLLRGGQGRLLLVVGVIDWGSGVREANRLEGN